MVTVVNTDVPSNIVFVCCSSLRVSLSSDVPRVLNRLQAGAEVASSSRFLACCVASYHCFDTSCLLSLAEGVDG